MNRAQELADPQGMFLSLHVLLHPEREQLAVLLNAGTPRGTLLQLYPFEPAEWFGPLVAARPAETWRNLRAVIISAAERISRTAAPLSWSERLELGKLSSEFYNSAIGRELHQLLVDAEPKETSGDIRLGIMRMIEALWLAASWAEHSKFHGTTEGAEYIRLFAGVDRALRKLAL